MRGDFFETVNARNRKDTRLLIDFEFVALTRLDLLAIEKPDHEHRVPLNWWGEVTAEPNAAGAEASAVR